MKKAIAFLLAAGALSLGAAVKLPAIFSDHAVLAKRAKVPVFGKAAPGEKVTVEFNGQKRVTTAGKDGKWRVDLNLANSPEGPFVLKVNNLVIKDVLVGQVWLCSGQSNMEFSLARSEGYAAIRKQPANRRLRSFKVSVTSSPVPLETMRGRWVYADPANVGTFSGVAYFFGRKIQKEINAPVGLINSSWGGSPIECWMRRDALKASVPATLKRDVEVSARLKAYPAAVKKYIADRAAWEKKNGRQDIPHKIPAANTQWKKFRGTYMAGGVVWLRRTFDIATAADGKACLIRMERQRVPFTVWCDGKKIADWPLEKTVRNIYPRIKLPVLASGKHEIMFRFYNPLSNRSAFLQPVTIGKQRFDGAEWDIYQEKNYTGKPTAAPKNPGIPPREFFNGQRVYNGCIAPMVPYALNGVLWYQGETNCGRYKEYAALQRALVKDWRNAFEIADLPFYWCNLPNFTAKNRNPALEPSWTLFRQAQTAALDVPGTGQAILIDVGEANDIHPINKLVPGERLAAIALANVYGKKVPFAGPEMVKVVREGKSLRISFKNLHGGLVAKKVPEYYDTVKRIGKKSKLVRYCPGTQLEGFAICGKDGKWVWAEKAFIDKDTVVVSSSKVPEPCRVRYAWQNNPNCNLYNKAGFPAAPFMSK